MAATITVIDVMKAMRIEITAEVSWKVGASVRAAYESRYGELPGKELRQKTSGAGSHCFAVYPKTFRRTIEDIISKHQTESTRQQELPL